MFSKRAKKITRTLKIKKVAVTVFTKGTKEIRELHLEVLEGETKQELEKEVAKVLNTSSFTILDVIVLREYETSISMPLLYFYANGEGIKEEEDND